MFCQEWNAKCLTIFVLISTGLASGSGRSGTRYAIQTLGGAQWPWNISGQRSSNPHSSGAGRSGPGGNTGHLRFRGRQLLDHEAISCLLILLFVDEPKLNISRLHRVLRNLCQHPATRLWVIQSLLKIMERTRETREAVQDSSQRNTGRKGSSGSQKYV